MVGLIKNCFNTGNVSDKFTHKIQKIIEKSSYSEAALSWIFDLEFGSHTCGLCGNVEGAGIFGIPSDKILYIAPTMILHFIEEHRYLPPRQFLDSVMDSPMPGTKDYEDAVSEFSELHKQYKEYQHKKTFEEASQAANKNSSPILERIHSEKRNKTNLISCKDRIAFPIVEI